MSDDSTSPAASTPTIRIQQTAERVEGDARIIGLNIVVESVNVQIHPPASGQPNEGGETPARMVIEINDPTTDILPLIETWLKAAFGMNVRIVVERDDERE
ncbi:MAG: hypothetical protein H6672_07910 [Anaerolineaceae bacterium]|nr:hypothetical protein [Anaerolineaceae bacterium]